MTTLSSARPPLRIGIVCFSSFGGSGVVATELGMALGRRGHRVCFLSDGPPVRLDPACPNVSFHQVPLLDHPPLAQGSFPLALAAKLIEVARDERLDVIHAHYAIPHAISACLARQTLGPAAPKQITTLHGTDVTVLGADPRMQPLLRLAVTGSDGVTAPSRFLADAARACLALPDDAVVEVIPNFVDVQRFSPAAPGTPATTSSQALRVLTHVSSFRPLKRIEDVVRIFAAIRAELPARLDLVGDGPERPRIEALVRSLGLDGEVRFLGERGELAPLLRESHVFLFPSQTESFGLAALEAMACGVPVVASDVGGIAEVVRHGETGFLAPMGDVPAMIQYVRRLLADGELHALMARQARARAERNFLPAPAVDRYEAAYRRALGGAVTSSSTRRASS
jgi:N-acetyl-alpha-D-glucosaminyl L-malate synthase BshA